MRITENRLRRLIRSVIVESSNKFGDYATPENFDLARNLLLIGENDIILKELLEQNAKLFGIEEYSEEQIRGLVGLLKNLVHYYERGYR